MKRYQVTIDGSGHQFEVSRGESVLAAALRQGVMLPYSCKNGTCGSCKGEVLDGEVHYPFHPPLALERSDIAAGQALFCQAEPTSDLVIAVREIEAVRDIQVRAVPARVQRREQLSDDVVRLRLRLPRAQRLQFLAGQYIDILLEDGKRRAFSIASPPADEHELELHVRHVAGGGFTGHVFDGMKEKDILRLEGPLGIFFIRHDQPDRPLIMMGGGTGFAPLKAMIEDLLAHGDRRPLHLYWGVRTEADLYLPDLPLAWAERHAHISYTPVLSEGDADWSGRGGLVHEAVAADYDDLSGFDVYMSGPPAMIDAARPGFFARGLPEDRLFYDSFEYGLDVPVRVLAQPH